MISKDNVEEAIKKKLSFTASADLHDKMLNDVLNAQEKIKEKQSAFALPNIRRFIMKNPITKFAVAAVVIIAVLAGVYPFGNSKTSVLWADVAERFESVPFFHLTMYIGDDTLAETKKIEIWKSQDSRVRAQEGNTVIFADFSKEGNKVLIYDRSTKQPVNSNGQAPMFLTLLCKEGQFSLETLTDSFPPGVNGITPVETVDTAASRETVLFEARHKTTPEQLTIWALRESKLPIRVCFSDPRKNEFGDFFFDYSAQKEAKFFDPKAFTSQ